MRLQTCLPSTPAPRVIQGARRQEPTALRRAVDVNNLASGDNETPTLCGSVWNERGIVSFRAGMMAKASMPRPTPFIAAGYLFAAGTMLEEVPFDPDLPQVRAGACMRLLQSRHCA